MYGRVYRVYQNIELIERSLRLLTVTFLMGLNDHQQVTRMFHVGVTSYCASRSMRRIRNTALDMT